MWVRISKKKCIQKGYIWNPANCACENVWYEGSVIDNSRLCVMKLKKWQKLFRQVLMKKSGSVK